MTELLKTLCWKLYTPYENPETEQELDDCHKQLIEVLGKPERKLVLRIIDGKDRLADEIGLDSFIFGFKLATQLAYELKMYNGHLHSERNADEDGRCSIMTEEENELPTIEEIRQEMIQRINEVRKENGASELTVNQSLMDAAQKCSAMLNTSHKNKKECLTVVACGYPHGFGSNLTVLVGTGMNRIAEKAVPNWVNSPGHFQTMVDSDCDTLGVGVTIDNGRAFCYMMVGNPNSYNPYG